MLAAGVIKVVVIIHVYQLSLHTLLSDCQPCLTRNMDNFLSDTVTSFEQWSLHYSLGCPESNVAKALHKLSKHYHLKNNANPLHHKDKDIDYNKLFKVQPLLYRVIKHSETKLRQKRTYLWIRQWLSSRDSLV